MSPAPARVLYVEHQLVDLLLMQLVFRSRPGLQLHMARSTAQALEAAPTVAPDLLLISLELVDGSGDECLRALRRLPECAQAKAVALASDAAGAALAEGFDEIWSKPLNLRTVGERIDSLFLRAPPPARDDDTLPPALDDWPSTLGEARRASTPKPPR
jgi:CheY-like chemotaxis protein